LAARRAKTTPALDDRSDLTRHGSSQVVAESYDEVGYNYRMTDIHGAIGLVQLERLDDMLASGGNLLRVTRNDYRQLEWLVTPLSQPIVVTLPILYASLQE